MQTDAMKLSCPAIMLAAPGGHQGRTSITAALARYHHLQGRRVKVFKAGPDFFDPLLYQIASEQRADNLDLWMVGESRCRYLLARVAADADLIILECPVGLYDTQSGCADIARLFNIPFVVVVDASDDVASAQNYIDDLVTLDPDLPLYGVLANKVSPHYQPQEVQQRLQAGVDYLGAIPFHESMQVLSKGYRLLQPNERESLQTQLDQAAELIGATALAQLPPPVTFLNGPQPKVPKLMDGVRVGVAKDEAFSFIYPANEELLESMGAELVYFSPLHDVSIPVVDSLWFPGGFPELYLIELAQNLSMKAAIRDFQKSGGHILAECGGMMYLLGSLVDSNGIEGKMVGLLPGNATFLNHLSAVGNQVVNIEDQKIRGHLYHSSRMESDMEPVSVKEHRRGKRPSETLYRLGNLTASFVHFYLPSNPVLTAKFLGSPFFTDT